MSGVSGSAAGPQPPPTKTVMMYRNGDNFFPPRKVVVNLRHMATFDSFLSTATRVIEAPFGAVRNVYTPRQGHRVAALEQLQHGEGYVAAGMERFKHLDYCKITVMKPQRKTREPIQPVVHSRIVASSRWRKVVNESCTINVFTNGDILVPPARVLIPKYTLKKWDNVLALVTQKVHLRTGAVHRLCTLDGTPLLGSIELENYQYYVAVGAEKFRFLPYFQCIPKRGSTWDKEKGVHRGLPAAGKLKHTKDALSDQRAPFFAEDPEDGEPLPPPQKTLGSSFYTIPKREKAQKHISKFSNVLSTGEGSVFVAKDRRKETMGAREVREDGRTKVDLPVDQMEARVVDDEQLEVTRAGSGADSLKGRAVKVGLSLTGSAATSLGESGRGEPGQSSRWQTPTEHQSSCFSVPL